MKNQIEITTIAICLFLSPFFSTRLWAAQDPLGKKSFTFSAAEPDNVLEKTVSNLKGVFERYQPSFDASVKIIRPLQIGGSASHPTLSLTARKCMLFICKEIELDATVTLRENSGSCRRNYSLRADLTRSSPLLAENFDALLVEICYQATGAAAKIQAEGYAHRSPKYEGGAVASEILKMLAQQIEPMTKALQRSLIANGARRPKAQ